MKDLVLTTKYIWTAIGACLGGLLGGMDGMLYALIAFIVSDIVTGFIAAVCEGKLSSKVSFKGLMKKVLILLLVGVGNIIDVNLLGNGSTARTAVIFFYVYNEGISVLENIARAGVPIPPKIRDILEQLGGSDNDGDKV